MERYWGFQNHNRWQAFLKTWKCFIPLRELRKQKPMGSIWQSFHYCCLRTGVDTFKICHEERPFWKLENVLSPGGRLLRRLLWGPIVFNLCFIGLVKGVWGFKNTCDDRHFWKLENVLSPKGSLLRGPIVFNLGFIWVDNGSGTFFSLWGYGRFENWKCFIWT